MTSIRIAKKWDLKGIHDDLINCAEDGIDAALAETTDWIKQDVLLDQKFVGSEFFPQVKETTRASKAKRGERQVLIHTGHLKDSWNFERHGLEGIVGSGTEGYFEKIYKKWRIDQLWLTTHEAETVKIIEKAIARYIK